MVQALSRLPDTRASGERRARRSPLVQPVVHDFAGWTDDEIRSVTAPTFLVIGDRDFVRLDHAGEMRDLFPDCRLAVLPATRHTEVMQRADELHALVGPFLTMAAP
jgi:pimeloyl-ACP methyl ester carboxylesterase